MTSSRQGVDILNPPLPALSPLPKISPIDNLLQPDHHTYPRTYGAHKVGGFPLSWVLKITNLYTQELLGLLALQHRRKLGHLFIGNSSGIVFRISGLLRTSGSLPSAAFSWRWQWLMTGTGIWIRAFLNLDQILMFELVTNIVD